MCADVIAARLIGVGAGKRKRSNAQQPLRLHKRSAGRVLLATGGTQPPPHGSRSSRLVLLSYGNACETWQQLPDDPLLSNAECWVGGDMHFAPPPDNGACTCRFLNSYGLGRLRSARTTSMLLLSCQRQWLTACCTRSAQLLKSLYQGRLVALVTVQCCYRLQ